MKNKNQNSALIYLSVDLVAGVSFLKQLSGELAAKLQIDGVSSIYKRYLTRRKEDLNSELCVVIKISTALSYDEVGEMLDAQLAERGILGSSMTVRAILLSFNNQVLMLPHRPLPHPQLHSDSITLRCAAEIYGNYGHPVLGQTLNELVKSTETSEFLEFFSQGRSILGDRP